MNLNYLIHLFIVLAKEIVEVYNYDNEYKNYSTACKFTIRKPLTQMTNTSKKTSSKSSTYRY